LYFVRRADFTVSALLLATSGRNSTRCDPVLTIAGAHFPAWLVGALAGALLAALLRLLFLALRIEAYLWPRLSRRSGDIGRHSLVQPFVTPLLATALNPHLGHKAQRR
jgi:hypothetical protein